MTPWFDPVRYAWFGKGLDSIASDDGAGLSWCRGWETGEGCGGGDFDLDPPFGVPGDGLGSGTCEDGCGEREARGHGSGVETWTGRDCYGEGECPYGDGDPDGSGWSKWAPELAEPYVGGELP